MIELKKLVLVASVFYISNAEAQMKFANEPCKTSDDCALFSDSCGELHSVLIENIKKDNRVELSTNKLFYTPKEEYSNNCDKQFVVEPIWPENPVPECIKNKCIVSSKKTKKK